MPIEPGMHTGGSFNDRRLVTAVEGGVVRFLYPISLGEASCSVAEFDAWLAEAEE